MGSESKALLVDLDDTLYAESSYVSSGFEAIAKLVANRWKVDAESFLHRLLYELSRSGRHNTFDRALKYFDVQGVDIQELVSAYRGHTPTLKFYPGAAEALTRMGERYAVAIVTDGDPQMQKRKVAALQLENRVDAIVYCWEDAESKPHPSGFDVAVRKLGVAPKDAIVVGDDPYKDMIAARRAGIRAYRVLTGRFADLPSLPEAPPIREYSSFGTLASDLLD